MTSPVQTAGVMFSLTAPAVFEKLDEFESDFIASLVRLGATSKVHSWSPDQEKKLATIYYKHVLLPRLPLALQAFRKEKTSE